LPATFFFVPVKIWCEFHSGSACADQQISETIYRDLITVGLLCRELKVKDDQAAGTGLIQDNWITSGPM
jgi:hypothetical protein